MTQIKFNFNNFIFYGASARNWQRATGISRRRCRLQQANNDVIALRPLRSLRCLRCVGWKARLTSDILVTKTKSFWKTKTK